MLQYFLKLLLNFLLKKRLLKLWLESAYKTAEWSLFSKLSELSIALKRVRMPSTTARHPRSILNYYKFKASELRAILLFGYSSFEKLMAKKYYDHFKQLVLVIHLAESRGLTAKRIEVVEKLSYSFLLKFPQLYGDRHNVQVIHSIYHISETIRDFGPLTSYTTFYFESLLGKLDVSYS